jgi:hypothetical protein
MPYGPTELKKAFADAETDVDPYPMAMKTAD